MKGQWREYGTVSLYTCGEYAVATSKPRFIAFIQLLINICFSVDNPS